MKIAVLCNSLMGIPSLLSLAGKGQLAALGIPGVEHDATAALRDLAPHCGVPLTVFEKRGFTAAAEEWLRRCHADAVLVYTFPWLVSEALLTMPSAGFLNFHFGHLPRYRGADAIFWEIRNRESAGAVTVHRMEAGLDTGPVALRQNVPLGPADTYGIHMANLATAAAAVTERLLSLVSSPGGIVWEPQDEALAKVWPKPGQRDVIIDWHHMEADSILALVRACNPWNRGAYTFLGNHPLRLTVTGECAMRSGGGVPGTLISLQDGRMLVACRDDRTIEIETVYIESGFFSGRALPQLGIVGGMQFSTPSFA